MDASQHECAGLQPIPAGRSSGGHLPIPLLPGGPATLEPVAKMSRCPNPFATTFSQVTMRGRVLISLMLAGLSALAETKAINSTNSPPSLRIPAQHQQDEALAVS